MAGDSGGGGSGVFGGNYTSEMDSFLLSVVGLWSSLLSAWLSLLLYCYKRCITTLHRGEEDQDQAGERRGLWIYDFLPVPHFPGSYFAGLLNGRRRSSGVRLASLEEEEEEGDGRSRRGLVSQHVVILEATSRLGKYLAFSYARDGCVVSIGGRDWDKLEGIARHCKSFGAEEVNVLLVEVCDRKGCQEELTKVFEKRPVDILFTSSGLYSDVYNNGVEYSERWNKTMDVDMENTLNVIAPLLPLFQQHQRNQSSSSSSSSSSSRRRIRRKSQIVIMSSIFAMHSPSEAFHLALSKNTLVNYGQRMRVCMRPHNISVSVILPGLIHGKKSLSSPSHHPSSAASSSSSPRTSPPRVMGVRDRLRALVLYAKFCVFRRLVYTTGRDAAEIIKEGVRGEKEVIAFPFVLFVLFWGLRCMPPRVRDFVGSYLG
eukprot:Nk52_evm1s1796 gene=Nk52_evmTU1s1796